MANAGSVDTELPSGFILEDHSSVRSSEDPSLPPGFKIEDNSFQAVNNPISKVSNNSSLIPNLANPINMDSTIANRPSLLKNALQSPINFQQHPFKRILQDAGAGFEVMEGIPASLGLDIQQGKPQNILPNIGQVLQGNRPAQRGDIMRSIGIPEPLAATTGFLSGMTPGLTPTQGVIGKTAGIANLLPENMAMNAITKGIGQASNTVGLTNFMNAAIKPTLATGLSALSGVPQKFVNRALDNPNILSNRWLSKEGDFVKNQYQKVVQPLIDDSTKTINVNPIKNIAQDVGLITNSGEFTKGFRKMTQAEQNKVLDWENQLSRGGDKSFNDVEGILGEMDVALKKTYTQTDKGSIPNFSNDGQRIINQMQSRLRAIRNSQFPDAGKVLDRYSDFKQAQNVYSAYNRLAPHMIQSILNTGAGFIHNPTLSAFLGVNMIPKVQGTLIRSGAFAGETGKGALLGGSSPEAMFNLWRASQQNNQ